MVLPGVFTGHQGKASSVMRLSQDKRFGPLLQNLEKVGSHHWSITFSTEKTNPQPVSPQDFHVVLLWVRISDYYSWTALITTKMIYIQNSKLLIVGSLLYGGNTNCTNIEFNDILPTTTEKLGSTSMDSTPRAFPLDCLGKKRCFLEKQIDKWSGNRGQPWWKVNPTQAQLNRHGK